jgi:replicative DNA helicase
MSERKVGYRLDTLIGHIPNGSLIHGNVSIQTEYEQFIKELPTMFTGSIKVLTPNMINGPADVNSLRVFIEKEGLDILFIDQLSLLEDQRHGKTPVEKAANISKDLKNLQVLKRVPIVSVSQQNRTKNEGGGVDTTQIAQSDRIGQDSTCIIFLEKDEDIIKLNLVKSRDSVNGKVLSYLVDFNRGDFTFIPEEAENEQPQQQQSSEDYSTKYGKQSTGEDVF